MLSKVLLLVLPLVKGLFVFPGNHATGLLWASDDKLIIGVDPGIDDIEAITLLLNQHIHRKVEVIAIFISDDNTGQHYGLQNTYKLLQKANALQIPVYLGSYKPIMPHHTNDPENYFGVDGFAGLKWDGLQPPTWLHKNTISTDALKEFVEIYPKKIVYFTLGPMTNLAMAMLMYKGISANLKAIYSMGVFLSLVVGSYAFPEDHTKSLHWGSNDKLVIDVDPGIDDIEAITLLLNQHLHRKVEIVAIIISEGNTVQDYGLQNTYRLLQKANALQIPVYLGSNNPILPHHTNNPENYFGKDGFGDLKWDGPKPPISLHRTTISPVALNELVKKYPQQIIYFTLGPMTNLALAMRMYNGISAKLKAIHAMGGMYRDETTVPEFNVEFDPESVEIVVDQLKCPMTFFTWQACIADNPPRGWFYDAPIKNSIFDMIVRAEKSLQAMHPNDLTWVSCDPMAAIAYLDNSIIVESYESPVQVQLDSGVGRGVISNFSNSDNPGFERHPVKVITKINMDLMQQVFLKGLKEIKTGWLNN